jgi:hypothetical protein
MNRELFRVNKPHVISPNDSDIARAQKQNRNFNDAWRIFSRLGEYSRSICVETQELLKDIKEIKNSQDQKTFNLQPGWDDIRVPLTGVQAAGLKMPGWIKIKDNGSGSEGVYGWGFDAGTEEELFFAVQIPHDWIVGSLIRPHIHWCPTTTNTGTVSFGLEYTKAKFGSAFGNTTILPANQAGSGTAYKHQLATFPDITMTGDTISTMLLCRIFRDATGSLRTDSYNADAALLEVDFHYKKNDLGSKSEYIK